MKNLFTFILILLHLVLYAENPAFDFQTSIDLMSGTWMESSLDIATLGAHPIELKRTFEPARREEIFTTNWSFNLPDLGKKEIPRRKWIAPKGIRCDFKYDSEGRITFLNVLNEKTGTDEGWLQFQYDPSQCKIVSNGGDYVIYGLSENNCLNYVENSKNERLEYLYIPHPIERSFLLAEKKSNKGQWIKLTYYTGSTPRDFKNGKIKELFYSEDGGETYIRTALLDYEPGLTTVVDAHQVLTRYRYKDLKIVGIETFLPDGSLHKSSELEWCGKHLIKRIEKNASGDPVSSLCRIYDQDNLVEETLEGNLTTLGTDGEVFKKFYRYDKENRLIEEKEENGLCIAYTYFDKNKRPAEKHVLDLNKIVERTRFVYDSEERLIQTWVEDEGNVKTFEKVNGFNFLNAPLEISKGIVNLSTDLELVLERTLYTYDEMGRVIKESKYDKFGTEVWQVSSYENNSLKEITSSNGSSILFFPNEKHFYDKNEERIVYYSDQGRVLKEESFCHGQKSGCCSYTYDVFGRLLSKIENGTGVTSYTYDCLGRKVKEETPEVLSQNDKPEKGVSLFYYDCLNRRIESTDPNGRTKQTHYNIRGQPLAEYYSDGISLEKSYYLNGQLEKETYPDKTFHHYSYDSLGRLLKKILFSASGTLLNFQERVYSGSLLVQEFFASGLSLHYFYDSWGKLSESLCPETGRRVSYYYDDLGELTHQKEYVDPESYIVKEAVKQEIPVSQEEIPAITWIYNNRGQLVPERTVQHNNGTFSKLLCDALNRVEQVTTYSSCGMLLVEKNLRHDFQGRKTKETIRLASSGEIITNIWQYDLNGNLTALIEGAGSAVERRTLYHYTDSGKLDSQTSGDGVTVFYTYETSGKISAIYSDDRTVDYTLEYDSNGRLHRILDNLNNSESTRTYTLDGEVLREKLANGLTLGNTYDLLGRRTSLCLSDQSSIHYDFDGEELKEITRKGANGAILYSQHYELDKVELIKGLGELSCMRNDFGQLTSVQSPYFAQKAAYDEKNRLISLNTTDSIGNYHNSYHYSPSSLEETGSTSYSYAFDGLENLTKKNNEHFSSNALNQFFSSEALLEYDLAGNLVKKVSNGNVFTFSYDAFGRMLQVHKNDECIHHYTYDIHHRRLSDNGAVFFLYDGNREIGTTDAEKTIQELRIFDETQNNCIAFELKGDLYAPISHINGSIACVVHAESKEVISFRYNAYGELLGLDCDIPWLFANKRYDPKTCLVHFGRRDYDPSLCRFITPDPIGFTDGSNRYAYCHNDPLNRFDVFGLQSESTSDTSTESPGFFELIKEKITALFESMKNAFCLGPREIFEYMTGNGVLLLSGYNSTEKQTGYYGKGELNNKVRVSYINGILTEESGLFESVKALSESHGNVNVHYVYRPTKGWVQDILSSLAVNFGFVSEQAEMLADLWKGMIKDMGGIDGGGKVIHYAHSIGVKETMRALSLLTKKEQQLIHVYAFGSPSVAIENPNYQVQHFISIRDGVCLLDLVSFIKACNGEISNVIFTGTVMGVPLVDHLFRDQTYQDIWKSMGRTFTEWYGWL